MLHLFCCCYFECNNEHPEDEIDMRDPMLFAVDVSVAINIKIVVVYYMYLLHELACNTASYCTSGRGIFTSRR